MCSKFVDGTEAERIGLANRVAPVDELDAATGLLVGELLTCAPLAIGLAKGIIDASALPGARRHARAGGHRAGAVRDERGLPRGRAGVRRAPPAAVPRPLSAASARPPAPIAACGYARQRLPEPVSIIGASGALGFGLAVRLARAGCEVVLGSRDLERAEQTAARAREAVPRHVRGAPSTPRRPPRRELLDPRRPVSQPGRDAAQPARRAASRAAADRRHRPARGRDRRPRDAHARRLAGLGRPAGAGDGSRRRDASSARCIRSAPRRCATSTTSSTRTSCWPATAAPTRPASRRCWTRSTACAASTAVAWRWRA